MFDRFKNNRILRRKRQNRIRAKVRGSTVRPRLSVFRSNKGVYLQLIDDDKGITICSASLIKDKKKIESIKLDATESKMSPKILESYKAGKFIAELASKKGIKQGVFDRGGYKYHGRVKAVCDGFRSEGLNI